MGAEGIMIENNRDVLIEDDPISFAEKLNKLIIDKEKRSFISYNGKKAIENNYFKEYNAEVLKKILEK